MTAATLTKRALSKLPVWARSCGTAGDIQLGMAVRICRNLPGHPFPGWSTEESRLAVFEKLAPAITSCKSLRIKSFTEISELNATQRRLLLERKLITPCLAARQTGCYVGVNAALDTSVMINEEEHLVIHRFFSPEDCDNAYDKVHALLRELDGILEFARIPDLGYLTSIPQECGDAIQMYYILHLPGLTMANMMDQVNRAAEKLSVSISPMYSREDDSSNCYLLCAGPARQGKTDLMYQHLNHVWQTLSLREYQIRTKLAVEKPFDFLDVVGRALGMLRYAYKLSYKEMLNCFSDLRMGGLMQHLYGKDNMSGEDIAHILAEVTLKLSPAHMSLKGCPEEEQQLQLRAANVSRLLSEFGINIGSPLLNDID